MELEKILLEAVNLNASDIHFTAGQKVFIRANGELLQVGEILTTADLEKILAELVPPRRVEDLNKNLVVDFSHKKFSRRFRINVYYRRNYFGTGKNFT